MLAALAELFASGRVADWVLGLMALEACALLFFYQRGALAAAPSAWLPNLLSGACLLLALRAALVGAAWIWVAAALAASLVGHLADLRQRWRIRR